MASRERVYRRLPGRGLAAFQNVRLYQAADHILQIASTGYSESYKRFYFRDIQAITIQKTFWGKLYNGVWGFLAVTFALPGFDMSGPPAVIMWSIGGCFGLCLAANLIAGPTCSCRVRTAVQTERLGAVTRIRTARRLLNKLRPTIAAAQGLIPREELVSRMHASFVTNAGAPQVMAEQRIEPSVTNVPDKSIEPIQ